jgi:hypothetical protein
VASIITDGILGLYVMADQSEGYDVPQLALVQRTINANLSA